MVDKNLNKSSNGNNLSNEGNEDDYNDNENDLNDEEKKRNKRRSKNDNDGRSYNCSTCGKSYLSYPALYTHIKTKHNTNGPASTRGRGRPKKDTGDINSMKLLYNPNNFDYFKHPERTGETSDLQECINRVFTNTFRTNSSLQFNHYNNYTENNLFNKLNELSENPRTLDTENSKCDEIFSEYLLKVSKVCRKEFFVKVLKFVCVFRECLNSIHKSKRSEEIKEYSETHNAEDAPDISNEFVTDFIEKDPSFFDLSKEDSIDLTQNFCQWLYDNNYTCSKLSLISS